MVSRNLDESKTEDVILLKTEEGESVYSSSTTWDQLHLSPEIQRSIELRNWVTPTLIQGITISLIMQGHNVAAQSKNGSGKTGSFVIATLCRIDKTKPGVQALCISHTRELSQQNYSVFETIARDSGIIVGQCEKGGKQPQCQVLCLTFGNLRNFSRTPSNLKDVKILIYDECDFLFSNEDSRNIILHTQAALPSSTQKILFSATFPQAVWDLVQTHIENPKIIRIEKKEDLSLDNIDQFAMQCEHSKKFDTVLEILKTVDLRCCIIFVNTKVYLKQLETFLAGSGYKVSIIASGLVDDREREAIIERVREGQVKVLLTTDLLSRGVDFRLVNLVINLDPPTTRDGENRNPDPETYLHRVGRTGRYGRRGIASNIISDQTSQRAYMRIMEYYGIKFPSITVENLVQAVQKVNTDYDI